MLIDNSHVVVLRGTGRELIPVPELDAFAERFGFCFAAHAIGDPNRKGRRERPFSFIENNFLAGRMFTSWNDVNQPRELLAVEGPHLVGGCDRYLVYSLPGDYGGFCVVKQIRADAPSRA